MRDNKTWCFAKILDVRIKKPNDEYEQEMQRGHHRDQSDINGSTKEYEYYITYLEHERRNDRWVPEVCLRIKDDEWVEEQFEKINNEKRLKEELEAKTNFMKNDVHHGM
jgi:hypothetical protein